MGGNLVGELLEVADVAQQFGLDALNPTLHACKVLSTDESIEVAVLGQFKSGKSSLLNAIVGEPLLPVGVLPVTAVITRIVASEKSLLQVRYLNGNVEELDLSHLREFVTEAANSANWRQVAAVDVLTPALHSLSALRLVETPGLGSVFAHNSEVTRTWMPNVGAAIITVSSERPLSDEDVRLVAEARETAPRVVVVLTKVDLLADAERDEVIAFVKRTLSERFESSVPILPFSIRVVTQRWLDGLREHMLRPLAENISNERQAVLALKLTALVKACREYLVLGLRTMESAAGERKRLHAAVLSENVNLDVMKDEIRLAEKRMCAESRPSFEKLLLAQKLGVERRVSEALRIEYKSWKGNLAMQARSYELWMRERLTMELTPLSQASAVTAKELVDQAEMRLRRVLDSFRDRLQRNVQQATGIDISPLAWEVTPPLLHAIPIAISHPFMMRWDLLWWLLPMGVVGGVFRRHLSRQVSWVVEMNLRRLVSDWTKSVEIAIAELSEEAVVWTEAQLNTLNRLLAREPDESASFREALRKIEALTQCGNDPAI